MTAPQLLRLSLIGVLALTQAGCLAAAVVGTAKGVGMAAGAVIPGGDDDDDDDRRNRRDR